MDEPLPHQKLIMILNNLDCTPEYPLPLSFYIRNYKPGDEENWLNIHRDCDHLTNVTPRLFSEAFGQNEAVLKRRQLYLCTNTGTAIGTASAWFGTQLQGKRYGRIHWVAIKEAFQGQGLSKPLLTQTLKRLHQVGHVRAYLTTSPKRLKAIKLYLQLGFTPLIRNNRDRQAWEPVFNTVHDLANTQL